MSYTNIRTALYCTMSDIESADWSSLDTLFSSFEQKVRLDKVYLETYRAGKLVSQKKIDDAKKYFSNKGITCSGGITFNVNGTKKWDFTSFCYSDEVRMNEMKKIIEFTSLNFDEIILDDFYFTNCKCDRCISEKGNRKWDEYRTEKMVSVSKLMMEVARKANAGVKIIIKYPNWYDDYQYTGYNLRDQRQIHDYIYTGTETRDPALTQQNLPRYLSYFLVRYLENSLPGKNAGGWFDPYDCSYNLNSYLEQAYLTIFAGSKEVTLFCMHSLLNEYSRFVPLAGYAFERTDKFLGLLGRPVGISCYKPFNSSGDNYLLPALGMIGIPMEPTPFYPENSDTVLLTKSSVYDSAILEKIKNSLRAGKTVVVTSGLAKSLNEAGLKDIIDIEFEGSVLVDRIATEMLSCAYKSYCTLRSEILIPKMTVRTNDAWPVVVGQSGENGYPLLVESYYSKGRLVVLNIPDRYSDLYEFPEEALFAIKQRIMENMNIIVTSESGISLFCYDNDHFILESFLSCNSSVSIRIKGGVSSLTNIETGEIISGKQDDLDHIFSMDLPPSNFIVFAVNR